MINDFDRAHMQEILANVEGFDWYTCHVLRLIAKADNANREKLRIIFPEEVAAYELWLEQ